MFITTYETHWSFQIEYIIQLTSLYKAHQCTQHNLMPKKLENNQISLSFFKNGDRLVELLTKNEVVTKRIASLIFATCFQAVILNKYKKYFLKIG